MEEIHKTTESIRLVFFPNLGSILCLWVHSEGKVLGEDLSDGRNMHPNCMALAASPITYICIKKIHLHLLGNFLKSFPIKLNK